MSDYKFEEEYWGNCCNTFDEDQKHYVYAKFMGLDRIHYSFDVHGKRILDVGGGPSSMLLKCKNLKVGVVFDPIAYPEWTIHRYASMNIRVMIDKAENLDKTYDVYDEAWIYNCLQHTEDPAKIIKNVFEKTSTLRIFEWINIPSHDGHPIHLTKEYLDSIIGMPGSGTVQLSESGCYGTAYYGVFTK